MKRNTRLGIALLVILGMVWFTMPVVNVMAGCFLGCGPIPPPIPVIPTVEPVHALDMDTMISFNDSDVGVVLYKVQGDASNIKMDVYGERNGSAVSSYLFSINQDDLIPFVKAHPAKNTLLAAMGDVSVYVLTTGEIQVNAGPDSEGKMHVKILDGIPWTTVYGYTMDAE